MYCSALIVFFVVLTELYRRMAVLYPGIYGHYESDIRARLSQGGNTTYSIFLMPEYFFDRHFGSALGAWFIGIYLALFTVGTIVVTFYFLKQLCPDVSNEMLAVFSFICLFLNGIFLYPLCPQFYSAYSGSVWHNESFIGMRFFALLVLLFFFRTHNQYMKRATIRDFLLECLLFTVVNWVKPNFVIAFAPAMLIMMIVDIVKSRGKGFVNWALYGIPVLIGSLIFLYQYSILYPSTGTVSENDSHVVFILGDTIKNQTFPVINFLCAFAFPVSVLIIHFKEIIRSKFYVVCYLAFVISFLEYAFIGESGPRMKDGNFSWGLHLFSFLVFCFSAAFFAKDVYSFRQIRNASQKKVTPPYKLVCEKALLSAHLASGFMYFVYVLLGSCAYYL